jgi:O-antigen ligase
MSISKLLYLSLVTLIYYYILNPYGWIAGIPVHYLVYVATIILLVIVILNNANKLFLKQNVWLMSLIILLSISYLFGANTLIGLSKGNILSNIIDDTNGYLLIVLALAVLYLTKKGFSYNRIISHVINASTIVAVYYSLVFISYLFLPGVFHILNDLLMFFNMGSALPYGEIVRVFLKAQIYCFLISVYTLIVFLRGFKGYKYLAISIVNFIPCLLSFTRSFWLAYAIVIIVFIILRFIVKPLRVQRRGLFLVSGFVFIMVIFFAYNPLYLDRLINTFSSDDKGNQIRLHQVEYTWESFSENIAFGIGAGGVYDEARTYALESTYNDALAKYGIIGSLVLMFFLIFPFLYIFMIRTWSLDRIPSYSLVYSYIGLLLISVTNPFLLSSLGMLFIGLLYGMILAEESSG